MLRKDSLKTFLFLAVLFYKLHLKALGEHFLLFSPQGKTPLFVFVAQGSPSAFHCLVQLLVASYMLAPFWVLGVTDGCVLRAIVYLKKLRPVQNHDCEGACSGGQFSLTLLCSKASQKFLNLQTVFPRSQQRLPSGEGLRKSDPHRASRTHLCSESIILGMIFIVRILS